MTTRSNRETTPTLKIPRATRQLPFQLAGFTRTDLVTVLGLLVLIPGFLAYRSTGEKGRIHQCASHLKTLGAAMDGFANDHQGELPPAAIVPGLSWDVQIKSYLRPGKQEADAGYDWKQFSPAARPFFLCPSDHVSRNPASASPAAGHTPPRREPLPRSYVMSKCDVASAGWPLTSASATGLGVRWDPESVKAVLGTEAGLEAESSQASLPGIKLSVISDPAHTLLLTELPAANNKLGNVNFTTIESAGQQYRKDNTNSTHLGHFNYLMVDGHVELFAKKQAMGENQDHVPIGIWTIKQGD